MQNPNDLMVDALAEGEHALTGYTMAEAVAFWERIFASYPTMDETVQGIVQACIEANKLAEE